MKHDELSHIDGLKLFSKLNVLKKVLQVGIHNIIVILNYKKKLNSFFYYRILLIVVAYVDVLYHNKG